ncbi:MAG: phage major capsid protein, partial [Anaerolineaceae bacterium]|nr:phage major capsid protein [Anaerolineaceae bacterium]
ILLILALLFVGRLAFMAVKHPRKTWRMLKIAFACPMLLMLKAHGDAILDGDAGALVPTEASTDIIKAIPESSSFMKLARRLPNMSRAQRTLPVSTALAMAYFVSGRTGLKQTDKAAWEGRVITAEELAVIIPIPESLIDDSSYDIWGEIKPQLVEAFGLAIDQAVFYGANAPLSWPQSILTAARAAGHVVAIGANVDLYDDLLSTTGTLALVEADGFAVDGHVGALTMKSRLRGLRDADGRPLFNSSMQGSAQYELDGSEIIFPKNGGVDPTQSLLISGQWDQAVYSIRQDITYKILTEAVVQDHAGNIIWNFAQQDMIGLRAVMRLGWQLPNPVNRINANAATRYPFAVLTP